MKGLRILSRLADMLGAPLTEPRYAVLNYHRFKSGPSDAAMRLRSGAFVDVADLEQQMDFLGRHTTVIRLSEMIDRVVAGIQPDRFYVAVTADDGYLDNLELGLPVLRRRRIPLTMFVTTGFVDDRHRRPWWDAIAEFAAARTAAPDLRVGRRAVRMDLSSESAKERFVSWACAYMKEHSAYGDAEFAALLASGIDNGRANGFMDWDRLRELASDDLVDIGAHSVGHPVLTDCADHGREDMCQSKAALEARLNRPVDLCAYPFGDSASVSPSVVAAARAAGFKAAFTLISGYLTPATDRFLLPRIGISGTDDVEFFMTRLTHADLARVASYGRRQAQSLMRIPCPL